MKQIGQKIIRLDRVDSTNNYTANLYKMKQIGHGSVILAEEQTNGRGQRGTTWQSEVGKNLMASLFVDLNDFSVLRQERINHWVALSLRRALNTIGIDAKVKWPNDIYVNDKKIAGLLIENMVQGNLIKASIIGVGLNVNQMDFQGVLGTSVQLETGGKVAVDTVLDAFLFQLNELETLFLSESSELKEEYLTFLWKKEEWVHFEKDGKRLMGKIIGTDDFGLLQMEVDGLIQTYRLKEISFIK